MGSHHCQQGVYPSGQNIASLTGAYLPNEPRGRISDRGLFYQEPNFARQCAPNAKEIQAPDMRQSNLLSMYNAGGAVPLQHGSQHTATPTQQALYTLIANVPFSTNRQDLIGAFRRFGKVELAMVVCNEESRHPHREWTSTAGYAFVRFSKREEAIVALQASSQGKVIIRGCKVRADWARKDSYAKKEVNANGEPKAELFAARDRLEEQQHANSAVASVKMQQLLGHAHQVQQHSEQLQQQQQQLLQLQQQLQQQQELHQFFMLQQQQQQPSPDRLAADSFLPAMNKQISFGVDSWNLTGESTSTTAQSHFVDDLDATPAHRIQPNRTPEPASFGFPNDTSDTAFQRPETDGLDDMIRILSVQGLTQSGCRSPPCGSTYPMRPVTAAMFGGFSCQPVAATPPYSRSQSPTTASGHSRRNTFDSISDQPRPSTPSPFDEDVPTIPWEVALPEPQPVEKPESGGCESTPIDTQFGPTDWLDTCCDESATDAWWETTRRMLEYLSKSQSF